MKRIVLLGSSTAAGLASVMAAHGLAGSKGLAMPATGQQPSGGSNQPGGHRGSSGSSGSNGSNGSSGAKGSGSQHGNQGNQTPTTTTTPGGTQIATGTAENYGYGILSVKVTVPVSGPVTVGA